MNAAEVFVMLIVLVILGVVVVISKRRTLMIEAPELPLQPLPSSQLVPTSLPTASVQLPVQNFQAATGSSRASVIAMIERTAANYGQDAALMKAVCQKESNFNPSAVNPRDPSYGLFQIQEFWIQASSRFPRGPLGIVGTKADLMQPEFNARVAANILQYFQGQHPISRPYRAFSFPSEIDVYNVGESRFRAGVRQVTQYRDVVVRYYENFKRGAN